MKQLLFLLLFPCLAMAQYQGNANQKITLGEQTTADGLVFRGVASIDTVTATSKITRANKQDTSAYILLDTVTNLLWHYKIGSNAWTQAGGGDTSLIAYVNTYGTQTVNGAKTFTSAVTGARFNPTANTATGTGMYLPAANTLGLSTNDIKRLEINGTGATTLTNSSGISNGNGINLRSGGNSASDANVLNFTSLAGTINVSMFSDAANSNTRLKSLGNLSLHTGNIGISADNERITILSTGNVGIGTTDPQIGYRLHVVDSVYVGGNVSASAYTTRSDYDLKDEIQNISYGINEVMQMQPVKYTYKSNGSTQLGFIAQDLGVITPEVVSFEDKMSVYYNALIPILTKAIQEQQTLIKALEQRIINLENK